MPASLSRHRHTAALGLAALVALAAVWAARPAPLSLPPAAALDALAAFFIAATAGGLALAAAARPPRRIPARAMLAALALGAAYLTTLTPLIPILILLASALAAPRPPRDAGAKSARAAAAAAQHSGRRATLGARLQPLSTRVRRAMFHAPPVLAAASLLVGYGALAVRGALRYDDPAAGAALDSFTFWFTLLAALLPILPLQGSASLQSAVRIAWLYPLARLYSLGPWNDGWSLATLLLGSGAALWCAVAALAEDDPAAWRGLALRSQLALALAGLGLGTGAGIAAGCYAMLAYLVLAAGLSHTDGAGRGSRVGRPLRLPRRPHERLRDPAPQPERLPRPRPRPAPLVLCPRPASPTSRDILAVAPWLLSGAVPFSAPFVAAWMLLGAGVAGGAPLAGAAAWLVALVGAAGFVLRPPRTPPRPLLVAASASLTLGVLAPAAVWLLILPVIEQLQGGLTVYGDVDIWPWVGIAALDSSRRGVAALPSVAVAVLMAVLAAAAFLLSQARRPDHTPAGGAPPDDVPPEQAPGRHAPHDLLADLRAAVPWLGGTRRTQEPSDDHR